MIVLMRHLGVALTLEFQMSETAELTDGRACICTFMAFVILFRSCDFNCMRLCVRQHVSPWGNKWSHDSKVSVHQCHCCLSTRPPLCASLLLLYLLLTGLLSQLVCNTVACASTTLHRKQRTGVPLPPSLLAPTSASFRTTTLNCSGHLPATIPPEAWLGLFPECCQVV